MMLLLTILSVASMMGSDRRASALGAQPGEWVKLLVADFSGDGQQDVVLGEATAVPEAYRRIQVRSSAGAPLLDVTDLSLFYLVAKAGSTKPILILGAPNGNWLGIDAYGYAPEQRRMQRLKWDGEGQVRGRNVKVDPISRRISMVTETGPAIYELVGNQLQQTKR